MKMKSRRLSIRVKLLAVCSLTIMLVIGVMGYDLSARFKVQMIEMAVSQASVAAQIGGVIFVGGFILIFLMIQAVVRGIRKVNEKLYELVHNEGDLTQTLEVRSGDEMEIMAGLVNELLVYIRDIMIQISKGSDHIKESSDVIAERLASAGEGIVDVSATMQEMSAGMEETSALSEQITVSVQNMRERITTIAGKALEGDSLAKEIRERAGATYAAAEQEQKSAKDSAREIESAVAEKIELSKTVNEIDVLTENIINITEQTNSNKRQDLVRRLRKNLRKKWQNLNSNRAYIFE